METSTVVGIVSGLVVLILSIAGFLLLRIEGLRREFNDGMRYQSDQRHSLRSEFAAHILDSASTTALENAEARLQRQIDRLRGWERE